MWLTLRTMDPDSDIPELNAKVRVGQLAEPTWGRLSWAQLKRVGIPESTLGDWVSTGYLHEELPRVYSVGHRAGPIEAKLAAALLYAGPGAMLSHQTAAWWWGLTDRKPKEIRISTPRRCRSLPGIHVHGRRNLPRTWHNNLTVTTVPQTLLDYAAAMPFEDVRYVLAEADYHRLIDLDEVYAITGRGKPGATRLKSALDVHWPELARTDSDLERAFLFLVEAGGLPRPQVNVRLCGLKVDCYWPQYKLAAELDGGRGHGTARQVGRDHGRDLTLRSAGLTVRRYAAVQVYTLGDAVLADLRRTIATLA
jgi:very-short-patch-repair endonuclease